MEVRNHTGRHTEVIRRENELISPPFKLFQVTVCTDSCFDSAHHGGTDCTNLSSVIFCRIHDIHDIPVHDHLLRIHLMLGQVFHIDFAEITQPGMQCQISKLAILNLQTFHQFTTEMKTGGGSHNRSFFRRKNILITIFVIRFYRTVDIFRQRGFTQCIQCLFKFIMVPVIKETQGTAT